MNESKEEVVPYFGVTKRKEKRSARKKFDGRFDDPVIAKAYADAVAKSDEYVLNGLPSLADRVEKAFYYATIKVQGKARYLGKTAIAKTAARLYDAALFHLWRFLNNPRPRFNFYRPGVDPIPPIDKRLAEVIRKIEWELRGNGVDPSAFNRIFNPELFKQEKP
jgi:hypothetical protein